MKPTIKVTKKISDFTIIPNGLLKNPELSMQAKGLLCYLLSLPNDWKIFKSELPNHFSNGRDAIYSAFQELIDNGYIIADESQKESGKFTGYNFTVSDYPLRKTSNGKTAAENPSLLNTNKQSTNTKKEVDKSTSKEDNFLGLFNAITKRKFKSLTDKTKKQFHKLLQVGYHSDDFKKTITTALYEMTKRGTVQYLTPEFITRPSEFDKYFNMEGVVVMNGNIPNEYFSNTPQMVH